MHGALSIVATLWQELSAKSKRTYVLQYTGDVRRVLFVANLELPNRKYDRKILNQNSERCPNGAPISRSAHYLYLERLLLDHVEGQTPQRGIFAHLF